jgi:hypothetical protein
MPHPELIQLSRVEELFDNGELDKALEVIDNFFQLNETDYQQKPGKYEN